MIQGFIYIYSLKFSVYGNKKCKKQEGLLEEDVKFADIFVAVGLLLSFLAVFAFIFSAQSIGNIVQKTVHDGKPEVSVTATALSLSNSMNPDSIPNPPGSSTIYTFSLAYHYHDHWSSLWYSGCDKGTYTMVFHDTIGYNPNTRANVFYDSYVTKGITCNDAITVTAPNISPGQLQIEYGANPTTYEMKFDYCGLAINGNNWGEPTITLSGSVYLFSAPAMTNPWPPNNYIFTGELSLAYMEGITVYFADSDTCIYNYYCPFPIAPGTTLTGYGS